MPFTQISFVKLLLILGISKKKGSSPGRFNCRKKVVPTWNCSQQGLWIILSNHTMIFGKRHWFWIFSNVFFGTLSTTSWVPSSFIILERRQTSATIPLRYKLNCSICLSLLTFATLKLNCVGNEANHFTQLSDSPVCLSAVWLHSSLYTCTDYKCSKRKNTNIYVVWVWTNDRRCSLAPVGPLGQEGPSSLWALDNNI